MSSILQINVNGKCRCYSISGSIKHFPEAERQRYVRKGIEKDAVLMDMHWLRSANMGGELSEQDLWQTGDLVELVYTKAGEEPVVKESFIVKTAERFALENYLYKYTVVKNRSMGFAEYVAQFKAQVERDNPNSLMDTLENYTRRLARSKSYSRVFERILDDDLNIDLLPQDQRVNAIPEYTQRLTDRMAGVYKYFLDATLHASTEESTSPVHNAIANAERDGQSEAVRDLQRMLDK